jgi:hypothetical protein
VFGLAPVPEKPRGNYRRLSRYDLTGLVWLLRGQPIIALTYPSASIRERSGNVTVYRRYTSPRSGRSATLWAIWNCFLIKINGAFRKVGERYSCCWLSG